MQSDIETVLISTDCSSLKGHIADVTDHIDSLAHEILFSVNRLNADSSKPIRGALDSIKQLLRNQQVRLDRLFNEHELSIDRERRALEFLGSVLSSITGVPSARDHRKMAEQLNVLRDQGTAFSSIAKDLTVQNQGMIDTLHFHEARFTEIESQTIRLTQEMASNTDGIKKNSVVISTITKAFTIERAIGQAITNTETILHEGERGYLSRHAIDIATLDTLVDKIYLRRKLSTPIYSGSDCDQYFNQELAHSWVNPKEMRVNTILQIPIAPLHSSYKVILLQAHNILQDDLNIALIEVNTNKFRYLSQSDFAACTTLREKLICQKREIRIQPSIGCIITQNNCETWADSVIHDITNTKILISLPRPMKAKLDCEGEVIKEIDIEMTCIITLNTHCKLHNSAFSINSLSFRQMHLADIKVGTELTFDIRMESAVLRRGHKLQVTKFMNSTAAGLDGLEKANENIRERLDLQDEITNKQWAEATGGMGPYEQIAPWSSLGGLCCITLLLALCQCKLQFAIIKGGPRSRAGGETAAESQENYFELQKRIIDVESSFRTKSIENSPDIELVD